jgi:hypothetical protein
MFLFRITQGDSREKVNILWHNIIGYCEKKNRMDVV